MSADSLRARTARMNSRRAVWGLALRQCSVSYNARKGTLRGLHYQDAPHEEHKLVRCTAGAIFDVIVDIRASSPTYRRWFGAELSFANRRSLFIPPGFAHGFMSLTDDAEVYYMISVAHAPAFEPRLSLERSRVRH